MGNLVGMTGPSAWLVARPCLVWSLDGHWLVGGTRLQGNWLWNPRGFYN